MHRKALPIGNVGYIVGHYGGETLTDEEWPDFNRRRGELIDRKIDGTITESERSELEDAQAVADRYIDRKHPMDNRMLDELEAHIAKHLGCKPEDIQMIHVKRAATLSESTNEAKP